MAGAKGSKLKARSMYGAPRKHYCPDHNVICQAVMHMPGRKMMFHCPSGCVLPKGTTVLRGATRVEE